MDTISRGENYRVFGNISWTLPWWCHSKNAFFSALSFTYAEIWANNSFVLYTVWGKTSIFQESVYCCCNFKNITKSLARIHQLRQCWEQAQKKSIGYEVCHVWGACDVPSNTLPFLVLATLESQFGRPLSNEVLQKQIPSQLTIQLILENAKLLTLYTLKRLHYFSRSKQYMVTVVRGTCLEKYSFYSNLTVVSMHTNRNILVCPWSRERVGFPWTGHL